MVMNETLKTIYQRRAVRKYKDQPVDKVVEVVKKHDLVDSIIFSSLLLLKSPKHEVS